MRDLNKSVKDFYSKKGSFENMSRGWYYSKTVAGIVLKMTKF